MSYDLKIYTTKKQNLKELGCDGNGTINNDLFVFNLNRAQISVTNEMFVEEDDIPSQICQQLPGIQYLIECNLEPFSENKKNISELFKLAKQIAHNGHGVIEDPQSGEIILPKGIKRVMPIEKTERFSVIEISLWFNHNIFADSQKVKSFLTEISRLIPEALPRRYGLYEPPQEKFSDIDTFASYLFKNMGDSVVWYPSKPIIDVSLSIPSEIGPTWQGYRFGYFSIEIDSAVLAMPGWELSITRFFTKMCQVFKPFYGDIRLINQLIRSRNGAWIEGKTEEHPIKCGWWNGIPRSSGLGLVLGTPLLEHIMIKRDFLQIENGCKLFQKTNQADNLYDGIEIPEGLFQPKSTDRFGRYTYTEGYPAIWPFDGPKIERKL